MKNAILLATCLAIVLVVPGSADALALRDPQTTYAVAGNLTAGSGGPTYMCHTYAAPTTATLSVRGVDANGNALYTLSFEVASPCGPFADRCLGAEGDDGVISGSCRLGSSFAISDLHWSPKNVSGQLVGPASFHLHVRGTIPVPAAGGPLGVAASGWLRGTGADADL